MNVRAFKNRTSRTHRRGWEFYAVGAAAVAVLLTATACEGDGEGSDDAKPSDRPSVSSSASPGEGNAAEPGESAPGKSTETPTEDPGTTGGDDGSDGGDKATVAACTEDVLSISADKEPADDKEDRHLLITVKNAGDTACDIYNYPYVQLGADAQSTVPVIKDSDPEPGKPVTLEPGKEAHAALLVAGGGRDEYEVNSITVSLQGKKPGSNASEPIDVPMPVDTLYADDGQLVTYWTTASGYAMDFISSK